MGDTGKNQNKDGHQAKGFGKTGGDIWDDKFWDDLLSDVDLSSGKTSANGTESHSGSETGAYRNKGTSSARSTKTSSYTSSGKKRRKKKARPVLKTLLFLIVAAAAVFAANLQFHFVDDIHEVPELARELVSEVPGVVGEIPELAQNLILETAEKLGISQGTEKENSAEELDTAETVAEELTTAGTSAEELTTAESAEAASAAAASAAEESADGAASESDAASGETASGESLERDPNAAQSSTAAAIWEETISAASALTDLSVLPGLEDDATEENLLALLYVYDLDGAFFLNYARNHEKDFMRFFTAAMRLRVFLRRCTRCAITLRLQMPGNM